MITIKYILTNVKYKGDALLQKYYIADFLTKKPVMNKGEVPQYYVECNHEAIISPRVFDLVQKEIEYRSKHVEMTRGNTLFSGHIRCEACGGFFGPKIWHSKSKYRKTKTELFLKALKKQNDLMLEFSENLWHSLADHATVYSKGDVRSLRLIAGSCDF